MPPPVRAGILWMRRTSSHKQNRQRQRQNSQAMAGRRKIIIDTDPGVDDAITIFAALLHPDVEVIGLTTIFGNCPTTKSTENALGLL